MAKKPPKYEIKWAENRPSWYTQKNFDDAVKKVQNHAKEKGLSKDEINKITNDLHEGWKKGQIAKGINYGDFVGSDDFVDPIKPSELKKKGPKDITPKTVDETADEFAKISDNEYPNMGKEEGPGYAKPKSYMEEKKIKPMNLPEAKAKLKATGQRLDTFSKKLVEKIQGKKKDFEKLYGGALDDILKDMKGGVPLDSEIPYNPEYTADVMKKAREAILNNADKLKEKITTRQNYVDLLGERLKDAAPKFPKKIPANPPFEAPEFGSEIPPRMEPPPIPKEALKENLYDPKVWKEFAKEQPIEPEVNWRTWEPQKLLEGPKEIPKGNLGRVIPNSWENFDFAKRGGGPSTSIEGLESMLQKMLNRGEDATSLMKEAAKDAAGFMKKNKMSSMEVLGKAGKLAPWIVWGVITYQFLFGDKAKAQAMAVETGLPLWPGVDFGEELSPGADQPYALPEGPEIPEGRDIQDYANLSRGLQG